MIETFSQDSLERAAELILQADALLVTAGVGMGIDSRQPDLRGMVTATPLVTLGGGQVDLSRLACPEAFRTQPQQAWGLYGSRLNLYRTTLPHSGFEILKGWGESRPQGYAVYTTSIDGQFQKAGFDQANIQERQGSIHYLQCLLPCCDAIWSADEFEPEVDVEKCLLLNSIPRCPNCGGTARPNVLMWGDRQWLENRQADQAARLSAWLEKVKKLVVVEVGAGTSTSALRGFSSLIAHDYSALLVRINPRNFSVPTNWDVGLGSGAKFALTEIDRLIQAGKF